MWWGWTHSDPKGSWIVSKAIGDETGSILRTTARLTISIEPNKNLIN